MKAIDLIIKLQMLDPNMQVVINVSPTNESFHLISVSDVDEIEAADKTLIMIFADYENEEPNLN